MIGSSGLESLETELFNLTCHQTPTGTWVHCHSKRSSDLPFHFLTFSAGVGIKLIVLSDPKHTGMDHHVRQIYELYGDYVMKNPFYTLEMPIRCELFDLNLLKMIKLINLSS
jgi:hypothetical protein